jgi:PIN domain nuclease of toxin-antitoxin system
LRLLLDTHTLVWAISRPDRLRNPVRTAVVASDNTVFVSAASAWEIAIKRVLGRLTFPLEDFDRVLDEAGFEHLPVQAAHGIEAGGLPRHHADPFDRMLIAQARVEDLILVSEDAAFAAYEVRRFGAGTAR